MRTIHSQALAATTAGSFRPVNHTPAFLSARFCYTGRMPHLKRRVLPAIALASAMFLVAADRLRAAEPPTGLSYDRAADFAVEERGKETRGDAMVRDITYFTVAAPKFGRGAAYVVQPRTQSPRAAILWVHWLGAPATTNRTEFLDEAVALASHGVVSLLVDAMWAKPRWYHDRVLEHDFDDGVAQVTALRRAIDLLQQQPGAGQVPLGIVGHDYGGMYSIIAAAQEHRAKTCVFVACTASLEDWAFFRQKPTSLEAYRRQNAPLELRRHVAALAGTPVLFQFAEHDEYIPLDKAQELFSAAQTPKQMVVYGGAEHAMTAPATIRLDRDTWLVRELGL